MYFNNCGNSSINKTFILEPQSVTGGTPVLSACTAMYTNLLESCSGDTTIQLGTGIVSFNSNVDGVDGFSANTIEASTYYSGGTNLLDIFTSTDTYVTGGTFNDVGDSLSLVRNDGANVIITGITNFFTTGGTYDNSNALIYFDRTDQLSAFTVDLSSIDVNDTFVSGGTYDSNTDTITLTRNDAGTVQITGITDTFTTGATLFGSTVYFNTNDTLSAYTADLSALEVNDTFVSGVTLSGNVLTIERNDGVDLDVNLDDIVFSGGSGNCITDLYVTNIHGCSPVTIHDETIILSGLSANTLTIVATPTVENTATDILVRDTDGSIKTRDVSSIISAASADTYVTAFDYDDNNNFTVTRNDSTAFTANVSVMSGLTVNGALSASTIDTSILSATLISATTIDGNNILSGGTNLLDIFALSGSDTNTYTTGGTYNDVTDIITITNTTGGTYSITGVTDTFVTGQTFNNGNYQLTTTLNDASNFVTDLSILSTDMVVTGGTYDINTGIVTFTNNSGATFGVSGFTSGMTDSFTTAAVTVGNEIQYTSNLYGPNFYSVDLTPIISAKTDVTLFNSHTADTSNPHQTTFSALTSTAHTHTISDVIDLQAELDAKALQTDLVTHTGDTNNPHNVTIEQLSGVSETLFETYTGDTATELAAKALQVDLVTHTGDTNNPHSVTIEQLSGVSETLFETYTGDTATALSGKVETSLFNTYTGDTATALLTKVEGANNVGSGAGEIFRDKTGTTLNFRTLSGGTNTTVTTVGDVNVIDVTLPADVNTFTTGTTVVGPTLYFDRNDALSAYTADLSSFLDNTNYYATGGTYNAGTESIDFSGNNIDANFSVNVSALIDDTNTFITGFTYDDANTLTIVRNDLASFSVSINTMTGLTVDGSLSAVTVSADTYYGDGSNLSGIVTTDNFSTGTTVVGNNIYFDRNDTLSAYTVDISEATNVPTDLQFQLFGNQSSTGLIEYDGLSGNTLDNSKFDIGPLKGWIVDNTTDPTNPAVTYIDYTGSTGEAPSGITLTHLATNPVTYVGISGTSVATVIQQTMPFIPDEHRDILELGVIVHSDNTIVNATNNLPLMGIDPTSQFYDLVFGLGYFNIDDGGPVNVYSAGSGMTIDKTGGDIFAHGSNYTNDPKNPHVKTLSSGTSLTFRYRLQDSTEWANTTDIDPNIYDNAGSTAATPTNKFTLQRISVFPSGISRLQYGQNVYDSLDDAEASIPTEPFVVESNIKENGLLRGFIIVKQGTTDVSDPLNTKFVNANHAGHAGDTGVGDVHRTEIVNHGNTGLREGGVLTVTVPQLTGVTYDVSAGSGVIINNNTTPNTPTLTQVSWDIMTGVTLSNIGGQDLTYIYIDASGNTQEQSVEFSETDYREKIILGRVIHFNNATVLDTANTPAPITDPGLNAIDLAQAIGAINVTGNVFTPQGGNLLVDKTSGTSFRIGSNKENDDNTPHITSNSAVSGATFLPIYRDGLGSYTLEAQTTSVNPTQYDDGSGTLQNVANNNWTIQRIFYFASSNTSVLAYGQNVYTSFANAKAAIVSDPFEVVGPVQGSVIRGAVIAKGNETDLSSSSAIIIEGGKFGEFTGGAGGEGNTDLQGAYNNSTQPEITTNSTLGGLTIVRGSDFATDNVFEVQDPVTVNVASISGEGYISGITIDGLTINEGGTNINTIYNTISQFDLHTGNTSNPHAVTFSALTSTAHTHTISDVTGLQTTLDTKLEDLNNLGSGEGLYTGKTGQDGWLKSIASSGGSVTVTSDGTTVNLEVPSDNNTFVTGGTADTGGTITLTRNDDVNVVINNTETKRFITTDGFDITSGVAYLGVSGAKFLSFDGTGASDEQGAFNFAVPSDYVSGGTFYIKFTTLSTGNDVQFEMNITSRDNGGDISTPTDTAIQNATTGAGTSWDMVETAAYNPSSSTFEPNKNVMIRLNRDASDVPDTYTGVAYVWAVVFEYTGVK